MTILVTDGCSGAVPLTICPVIMPGRATRPTVSRPLIVGRNAARKVACTCGSSACRGVAPSASSASIRSASLLARRRSARTRARRRSSRGEHHSADGNDVARLVPRVHRNDGGEDGHQGNQRARADRGDGTRKSTLRGGPCSTRRADVAAARAASRRAAGAPRPGARGRRAGAARIRSR